MGCLLFGGRGRLTRALNRRKAIELIDEAKAAGARLVRACLKERCHRPSGFGSRQCQQSPLILHADNGNALAAGFCLL